MGFWERFRRQKGDPAVDPAMEPRNNRQSLVEGRTELQNRVLRDLRRQQIGAEAIFPDESMLVRYGDDGDEAIRASLGIPPARFYIRQGESGPQVTKIPVQKPIFTPENRPQTLIMSEKLFDRGINDLVDGESEPSDEDI